VPTPEELILDFGLNPRTTAGDPEPIKLTDRVVMNYFTAKRFHAALQIAIERHEKVFGTIETDILKRARPGAEVNPAGQR